MPYRCFLVAGFLFLAFVKPAPILALGPDDVYIVVNKNVPDSQVIADHYCAKRRVPADHVLALDLPKGEDISRTDFDAQLAAPLREWLGERRDQAKVLLTVYGVPLRVGGQLPTLAESAEIEKIRQEIAPIQREQKQLDQKIKGLEPKAKNAPQSEAARELALARRQKQEVDNQLRSREERRKRMSYEESHAAVDSELSLLWHEKHELRRFMVNPLNFQITPEERESQPPMLMTCRLDGPNVELVKRLIDQAVETEAKGLDGKVYVDARGLKYTPPDGYAYGGYDESMREMAALLEQEGKLTVTLNDKPELFASGECTDCAMYCGWYSVGNYVDCCRFVPGAIAWHLASFEAVSLRDPKSKQWCKNLLVDGAAATLGPVAEPYAVGFPKPAEFFGSLATGKYTLVEAYWRTETFTSWMMVLVGDPLYNPYLKSPKLKIEQVRPSPAGSHFLIRR
jgi:uncharacterized protein (TIGR03790 family)